MKLNPGMAFPLAALSAAVLLSTAAAAAEPVVPSDTDGNGVIPTEEIRAAHHASRAALLAEFDADGDGELSRIERDAARDARGGGREQRRGRGQRSERSERGERDERGGSDDNAMAPTTDAPDTTTDSLAATASTTAGVECDYMDTTYNDSLSVNAESRSAWSCSDTERQLSANGIPDHAVGTFPSPANPNTIAEQSVSVAYTLDPEQAGTATELGGPRGAVGYVLNGIKMDPGTGGSCDDSGDECSLGDPSGNWSIEALGQDSFDFGDDFNNAHVQPGGAYHYHGLPEGFIDKRGGSDTSMTLIGWAADGFPIYARYGYSVAGDASSPIVAMQGSYRTVQTVPDSRPSTDLYALGTFSRDWQYVAGLGDLDECNGRTGVTPEFPGGIYHYFATDSYPFMQRCVTGAVEGSGAGPAAGGAPGAVQGPGSLPVGGTPPEGML